MKNVWVLLSFFWVSGVEAKPTLSRNQEYLVLNAPQVSQKAPHLFLKSDDLPRQFRVAKDLRVSGSAEFSVGQLKSLVKHLKTQLGVQDWVLIDLRQESHGFVNDAAVGWYNYNDTLNQNKTLKEIELDERSRLASLQEKKKITLTQWQGETTLSVPMEVTSVSTEQSLAEKLGIQYFRIPSPDHQRPRDQDVDRWIEFYRSLNPNGDPNGHPKKWIHFHCAAGRGRTTTYMAMLEMMRRFDSKINVQAVFKNQLSLGGVDLLEEKAKDPERQAWAKARKEFLIQFDRYCKNQGPQGFKVLWSEWIRKL